MFAKRPDLELDTKELANNPKNLTAYPVDELNPGVASEEPTQVRNDLAPDRAKLLIFPSQPSIRQPAWCDYEELFPSADIEATERLTELTSAVINRRCYYQQYWPKNTVFRIKDIDVENQAVYLNLVYRWVSAAQVLLIKNLMPQRPPRGLELDYLVDDDASDF